jgi:hypothetical protein
MIVLAGPIASGKTTRFRELQTELSVDSSNVDDSTARFRTKMIFIALASIDENVRYRAAPEPASLTSALAATEYEA